MDSTYMEVGTEVIISRCRSHLKERFLGHRGTIVYVQNSSDLGVKGELDISAHYSFWWYPDELILATDEPLLRK
jgi:hypothetical protein